MLLDCYLSFMQTLTTLDLQGNEIGDAGAEYLATALQMNKVKNLFHSHHLTLSVYM